MLPPDLLTRSAEEAARLVILARLDAARDAAGRLADENDVEALHDVRVAIRRVRSALDAYRDLLPRKLRGKPVRALRQLQGETGAARDAEVALAWLRDVRPALAPAHVAGYRRVLEGLSALLDAGRGAARESLAARLAARDRKLRASLVKLRVRLDDGGAPRVEPCHAEDVASRLRAQARRLTERLGEIADTDDVRPAHRARIQAKRLRYLAEPLAAFAPQAAPLIAQLRGLQDALGELNDCHVLRAMLGEQLELALREHARTLDALAGEANDAPMRRELRRSPRSGIVALIKRAQQRTHESFEALRQGWLGGRDRWEPALESLAAALDSVARAGIEIERKYLLSRVPEDVERLASRATQALSGQNDAKTPGDPPRQVVPLLRLVAVNTIEQGYLPGKRIFERLRRETATRSVRHLRTFKSGTGVRRIELEEVIDAALFEALWPATAGARLVKERIIVEQHGQRYEIDRFLDRDLVLAEIELTHDDAAPELPAWLARCVVREVTSEHDYENAALARFGTASGSGDAMLR